MRYPTPAKPAQQIRVLPYLYCVKQLRRVKSDALVVNYGVVVDARSVTVPHNLGTAAVFPAAMPNWNTICYLTGRTASNVTITFNTPPVYRGAAITVRITTFGGSQSVPADALTAIITHSLGDTTTPILVTPTWNTVVYKTARTGTTLSVGLSTAPSTAQSLLWSYYTHLSDAFAESVDILANERQKSIEHGLGIPFADILALPSWNASLWINDRTRTEDAATMRFNVAPSASETLDIVSGAAVA